MQNSRGTSYFSADDARKTAQMGLRWFRIQPGRGQAGIIPLLLYWPRWEKEYGLSRSISINRPVTEVYDYVRFLKNQGEYNTWTMMYPEMKKLYTGTGGQIGFIYAWDENKQAGAG